MEFMELIHAKIIWALVRPNICDWTFVDFDLLCDACDYFVFIY